jgi:hypothetical protein
VSNFLGTLAIAANAKTSFLAPNEGLKAIRIGNESGLTVVVKMESAGIEKVLYPSTVDWFPVTNGFDGNILLNPMTVLNNVTTFPASELLFDAIGLRDREDGSQYPIALPRVTNQGNSATVPGASTSIVNDGNAANTQVLESTVLGDGASAVKLTNDGILTIGSAVHPGSVSFDHGKITSDGSGDLTMVKALLTTGSISRIATAGPYAVDTTPGDVNHGLGAKPDYVFAISGKLTSVAISITANFSTMNSTTVTLQSNTHLSDVYILAIKF